MTTLIRFFGALTLGVFCCPMGSSQAPAQRFYARDLCVKGKDVKAQEYAEYPRDVATPLAKVRVDAGITASYTIAQAVSPAGRSARCDYHLVTGFNGFPPGPLSAEQIAADMKKAGISITQAMVAKRIELSELVGLDIWMFRERVGTPRKDGYARINYDKIHPGKVDEWATLESNGWKQPAEAASQEYGTAWRAATLVMPGGANLPYNALTIDIFPSWHWARGSRPGRSGTRYIPTWILQHTSPSSPQSGTGLGSIRSG